MKTIKTTIITIALLSLIIPTTLNAQVIGTISDPGVAPISTGPVDILDCDPNSQIKLNVPIGDLKCLEKGEGKNPLGNYIQLWYGFVIGMVGILSAVIIMYAGFKWLTSRGNSSVISDSKEKIWAALTGLLLAFLSFVILNIVNPKLLTINLPTLEGIKTTDYSNKPGSDDNIPTGGVQLNTPTPEEEPVRQTFANANVSLNAPSPQTQVGGLTQTAINQTTTMANAYKEEYGRNADEFVITGGSERAGHSSTGGHPSGESVDIRANADINKFVTERILSDATLDNPNWKRDGQYPRYSGTFNGRPVIVTDERNRTIISNGTETSVAHWDMRWK